MQYLLDTNAIIRHFASFSKIGKKAKKIINEGESNQHQLFISVISLMEIMFLAEKNRIPLNLTESIKLIKQKSCYSIINFNTDILQIAENVDFYELHDRLILATAKYLNCPILSSDKKFKEVFDIETIWK
ncbi:MAG: PIN domain-containing protein [Bacteroidales bacterium]|nr:PIN domain-containing protein [Bacteroidales bacterium]